MPVRQLLPRPQPRNFSISIPSKVVLMFYVQCKSDLTTIRRATCYIMIVWKLTLWTILTEYKSHMYVETNIFTDLHSHGAELLVLTEWFMLHQINYTCMKHLYPLSLRGVQGQTGLACNDHEIVMWKNSWNLWGSDESKMPTHSVLNSVAKNADCIFEVPYSDGPHVLISIHAVSLVC